MSRREQKKASSAPVTPGTVCRTFDSLYSASPAWRSARMHRIGWQIQLFFITRSLARSYVCFLPFHPW